MSETTRVGTRELKAKLSDYLRQVEGGRDFLVTRRGGIVAALVPLETVQALDSVLGNLDRLEQWLRIAVEAGDRERTAALLDAHLMLCNTELGNPRPWDPLVAAQQWLEILVIRRGHDVPPTKDAAHRPVHPQSPAVVEYG